MDRAYKYKKYLSPFGRDVLEFMINQWKEDQLGRNNSRHQYYREAVTRRTPQHNVINSSVKEPTFDEPRGSPTFNFDGLREHSFTDLNHVELAYRMREDLNNDRYVEDRKMHNKGFSPPAEVQTFGQLISSKGRHIFLPEHSDEDTFNHNDPLVPFSNSNPPDVMVAQDLVKVINNDDKITEQNANSHIDWDDMFDLGTLDPVAIKQQAKQSANEERDSKPIFDIQFPNDKKVDKLNKKVIKIISDETIKIEKYKKPKKRGNSLEKKTKPAPKKVKKSSFVAETSQINLRKDSYAKTVQKWLSDVTANSSTSDLNEEPESSDHTPLAKVEVHKQKKDKTDEKKVQAKLANKDGVMKFKKPEEIKVVTDSSVVLTKDIALSSDNLSKEFMTQSSGSKAKGKPKFVAPIKSQIPVKDVVYNILFLDESNKVQFNMKQSLDITFMLLYSNGFCQLNSQHTDDDLIPTGILVRYDENKFYHIEESNSDVVRNQVMQLLKRRVKCFDAKKILIYLRKFWEIQCDDVDIVDAKIGASLLDPDKTVDTFKDLQSVVSFVPEFTIATECVLQKSAWYLTLLQQVTDQIRALLVEESLWNVFLDIEMNLLPIIAGMEYRGVQVDLKKLKTMEGILLDKLKSVEQECYKAAGKSFQINSTLQVRNILYDELNLDTKSNVKIKETITTGAKSTSESMLRSLADVHQLPKLILEYRHLHKAHATFVTGIAQFAKEDVVRPVWDQMAAVTGRIASNNPNLQAIPKTPFNLVIFPDENSENQVLNFRSIYVSRPGFTLVAADFQHIECRVFAYAAADTSLVEILQSGDDLFRVLAAKWLKKSENDITAEDRERTKRIVYASLYGAGARKLMDILQISYEQTLSVISSFNRTFPSLKGFGRSVVSRCEAAGGRLTTLSGRARRFIHITSCDYMLRAQAERQAVNFIVQGSAADLCKKAMILTQRRLQKLPEAEARLLLSIHDELVWEVRDQFLEEAAACIKKAMEGSGAACGLPAELPVALSVGHTWGDMLPYSIRK